VLHLGCLIGRRGLGLEAGGADADEVDGEFDSIRWVAFAFAFVFPFAFSFLFFGFLGLFSFAFVDEFVFRFSFDSSGVGTVSGDSPSLVGRLTSIATV